MTESNYKYHKTQLMRVHGRGGNGNGVLIEFDTIPAKCQEKITAKYGNDLHKYISKQPITKLISVDYKAANIFAGHIKAGGGHLPLDAQQVYTRQAEWLNMINLVLTDRKMLKDTLGISIKTFWEYVIDLHQGDRPVNPKLPKAYDPLRKLLAKYNSEGPVALISKKFGNQNTRKVTPKIENLIVSLYFMKQETTLVEVCRMYRDFIYNKLQVVDINTGEVFNPQEFYVKGEPFPLGESTVDFYLKRPAAQIAINKKRLNNLQWRALHRPYVQRMAPVYAFSKLTMDDRDLPFKDMTGNRPAKTYQIADVASGAIIGKAFSTDKNVELLREAFRDMFQTILCNGWGMPFEIEMERHLTAQMMGKEVDGQFEDDILTAGNLFKHVRVCLGGNAPEKRMEHIFRQKKYTFDNKRPGFQGRFYARNIANRLNTDKDKVRYAYEQIIQNDLDDINSWNNSLHPNQELYPGMSRWDVLENCQNPNLVHHATSAIMPYVGYKARETSIKRGYVQVMKNSYRLPNINILRELKTWKFDAYYIPGPEGIEKVYLYQYGKFIAEATKVIPFQEAQAEMTDADRANADKQWAYQAAFDKMVRETQGSYSVLGTARFDGFEAGETLKVVEEVVVNSTSDEFEEPDNVGFVPKKTSKRGGYKQKEGVSVVSVPNGNSIESAAQWAL
ncbi:hypothetical protein CJD36_020050 [Flavipsychrobacter stenotrophus]|uniref:Uncharacterized protein n=2 Tax=Flavipsychrobacter stenotrophus TaxID=2077091 RepID=A0A2S7SRJ2_9BACT|nr:hypothetical protein CJD36_020050 [Flavipsychrobacter stenotrophus]